MTRPSILFIEDQAQADAVAATPEATSNDTIIAMTAEACEALARRGIDCVPVGHLADVRRLTPGLHKALMTSCWSLCRALDDRLRDAFPIFAADGPGLLAANVYSIQYAMTALLTRFFLMREAVRSLRPAGCRFPPDSIHVSFDGQGYDENPWTSSLKQWLVDQGIPWRPVGFTSPPIRSPRDSQAPSPGPATPTPAPLPAPRAAADGFRLLLLDTAGYDWEPVVRRLTEDPSSQALIFESRTLHADTVPPVIHSRVRDLLSGRWRLYEKRSETQIPDHDDLVIRIDRWCREGDLFDPLGDIDASVWQPLVPYLAHRAAQACATVDLMNELANDILDDFQPDAVGMIGTVNAFAKRLCWHCLRRGVPTVMYQHGGSYGTCIDAPHLLGGFQDCDYFLSYGPGIRPPDEPDWDLRATFVSVGSTRCEAMTARRGTERRPGPCRALWIGGTSHRNTIGGFMAVEDTERYEMVSECLQALSAGRNLHVRYRPFPPTLGRAADGVRCRLERNPLPGVVIDAESPLVELAADADIILTDIHCNTTWDEAAVLGKPLILFCDPDQTALFEPFQRDVDRTFCWCRTRDEMLNACRRLALDPGHTIADLAQRNRTDYLRHYVLGETTQPTDCVVNWLLDLKCADASIPDLAPTVTNH
jgi:hypothetical protein